MLTTHYFGQHFVWCLNSNHQELHIDDDYALPFEYIQDIKLTFDKPRIRAALTSDHYQILKSHWLVEFQKFLYILYLKVKFYFAAQRLLIWLSPKNF